MPFTQPRAYNQMRNKIDNITRNVVFSRAGKDTLVHDKTDMPDRIWTNDWVIVHDDVFLYSFYWRQHDN